MSGVWNETRYERAAGILIDAAFFGDTRASERWGLTTRTIRNYWTRLETDGAFSDYFRIALIERKENWADRLTPAILAAIDYIEEALRKMDKRNPQALEAVTKALLTLADVQLTTRMLDARLDGQAGPPPPPHGSSLGSSAYGIA